MSEREGKLGEKGEEVAVVLSSRGRAPGKAREGAIARLVATGVAGKTTGMLLLPGPCLFLFLVVRSLSLFSFCFSFISFQQTI